MESVKKENIELLDIENQTSPLEEGELLDDENSKDCNESNTTSETQLVDKTNNDDLHTSHNMSIHIGVSSEETSAKQNLQTVMKPESVGVNKIQNQNSLGANDGENKTDTHQQNVSDTTLYKENDNSKKLMKEKESDNITNDKTGTANYSENSLEKNVQNSTEDGVSNVPETHESEKSVATSSEISHMNFGKESEDWPQRDMDFSSGMPNNMITNIKSEMTDEEIMHHLDELENIVLHSPSFIMQDDFEPEAKMDLSLDPACDDDLEVKPQLPTLENGMPPIIEIEEEEDKSDVDKQSNLNKTIELSDMEEEKHIKIDANNDEENKPINIKDVKEKTDEEIYLEKLKAKKAAVKDRLARLARVLEYSYPPYRKWLGKVEGKYGTAVCQLDESRHGPLSRRHTNRWKFICHKTIVDDDDDVMAGNLSSKGKNKKLIWKLGPSNAQNPDIEKDPAIPAFIVRVVKVFEEFLQFEPLIQREAAKDENTKREDKKEFTGLSMRANCKNEVMVIAVGCNISPMMMDVLKKYFHTGSGSYCNVKSLYCKSFYSKVNAKNFCTTTFLYGTEVLDETVGNIKIQLAPRTNFWSNVGGVEVLANTIDNYLTPYPNTTLLEIGCGIGLISLMMASKYEEVVGLDLPSEIEEAQIICDLNKVTKATFIKDEPGNVEEMFKNLKTHHRIVAIVNNNANCGRSLEVIGNLRKLSTLKKLVMIATFTKQSIRSILELMHPADDVLGNPFIPIRCCVVDTVPDSNHFEVVILMERRVMRRLKPKQSSGEWVEVIPPTITCDKMVNPMFNKGNELREQIAHKRGHDLDDPSDIPNKISRRNERSAYEPCSRNDSRRFGTFERGHTNRGNRNVNRESNANEVVEVLENVKQQQIILEKATRQLSTSSNSMDPNTARQLKSMLNIVLEQTNKLQTKLPLIAQSHEGENSLKTKHRSPSPQQKNLPILLPGKSKKYQNIQPLEPNLVMPVTREPRFFKNSQNNIPKKQPRQRVNERLRKNALEVNGWSVDDSPPRILQEGSPPRMAHESAVGYASPSGSSSRYSRRQTSPVRGSTYSSRHRISQEHHASPFRSSRRRSPVSYGFSSRNRYEKNSSYRRRYHGSPLHRRHESLSQRTLSRSPTRQCETSTRRHYERTEHSPDRYYSRPLRRSMSPQERYSRSPPKSPPCYTISPSRDGSVEQYSESPPRRTREDTHRDRRYTQMDRNYYRRENEEWPEESWENRDKQHDNKDDYWDDGQEIMEDDSSDYGQSRNECRSPDEEPVHLEGGARWCEEETRRSKSQDGLTSSEDRVALKNRDPRLRGNNRDSQMDDLPEDAKDPWGDDSNVLPKEDVHNDQNPYRWQNNGMPHWQQGPNMGPSWMHGGPSHHMMQQQHNWGPPGHMGPMGPCPESNIGPPGVDIDPRSNTGPMGPSPTNVNIGPGMIGPIGPNIRPGLMGPSMGPGPMGPGHMGPGCGPMGPRPMGLGPSPALGPNMGPGSGPNMGPGPNPNMGPRPNIGRNSGLWQGPPNSLGGFPPRPFGFNNNHNNMYDNRR